MENNGRIYYFHKLYNVTSADQWLEYEKERGDDYISCSACSTNHTLLHEIFVTYQGYNCSCLSGYMTLHILVQG